MGNRVSIQFCQKSRLFGRERFQINKTVPLCHHWGGTTFPVIAENFAIDFHKRIRKIEEDLNQTNCSDPVTRLDPDTVLVQFLMWMATQEEFKHYKYDGFFTAHMYLGKDLDDVDNSDNGNYEIWLPNDDCVAKKSLKNLEKLYKESLNTKVEVIRDSTF